MYLLLLFLSKATSLLLSKEAFFIRTSNPHSALLLRRHLAFTQKLGSAFSVDEMVLKCSAKINACFIHTYSEWLAACLETYTLIHSLSVLFILFYWDNCRCLSAYLAKDMDVYKHKQVRRSISVQEECMFPTRNLVLSRSSFVRVSNFRKEKVVSKNENVILVGCLYR